MLLQPIQTPISLRSRVATLAAHPNAKFLVVGVAAVALTPVVLPLLKPALKATVKTGVALYERAKIAVAETTEVLADIAAEARAEVHSNAPAIAPTPTPAAPAPSEGEPTA
jgi:hypothetical protein